MQFSVLSAIGFMLCRCSLQFGCFCHFCRKRSVVRLVFFYFVCVFFLLLFFIIILVLSFCLFLSRIGWLVDLAVNPPILVIILWNIVMFQRREKIQRDWLIKTLTFPQPVLHMQALTLVSSVSVWAAGTKVYSLMGNIYFEFQWLNHLKKCVKNILTKSKRFYARLVRIMDKQSYHRFKTNQ